MKDFKTFLVEELQKIFLLDRELTWNQNKTSSEFKDRIKQRTDLSETEFCSLIQRGINLKAKEFPTSGDVCFYFILSKFVLIINMDKFQITTIRDGRWDKPSNGCNKTLILAEDSDLVDLINNVFCNETEFEGYRLNVLTESEDRWLLEVETFCDVCLSVNL